MRFITDEEARRLGAPDDPEQRREVLRDAEALYDLVAAQPWIDEAAVRVLSERRDLSPERTTSALRFRQARRSCRSTATTGRSSHHRR